jgi:hypothetical protein
MGLLAGSYPLHADPAAYPMLLLATAALGLGTALSPFLIAIFTDLGRWWYLPLLAAAGLVVLIVAAAVQPMSVPGASGRQGRARIPGLFWLFAAALVIYGVAETMFGN